MKTTAYLNTLIFTLLVSLFTTLSAQEGNVVVYQDSEIQDLLELKKQITTEEKDTNRYKINIFSGSRSKAESIENSYKTNYYTWRSKMVYETPNYKIYIGNFRTRLEADRALIKIKKKFPNAFIFKPKKTK